MLWGVRVRVRVAVNDEMRCMSIYIYCIDV